MKVKCYCVGRSEHIDRVTHHMIYENPNVDGYGVFMYSEPKSWNRIDPIPADKIEYVANIKFSKGYTNVTSIQKIVENAD